MTRQIGSQLRLQKSVGAKQLIEGGEGFRVEPPKSDA